MTKEKMLLERTDQVSRQTIGAWIVHHGQKTSATVSGAAEYPALDAAAKTAGLLSQLSATEEITLGKKRVEALARAAGLNPKTELPSLLGLLQRHRLIDKSVSGEVVVLGVTSRGTLQHAADIFDQEEPSPEERAAITLAELSSSQPMPHKQASQFLADSFRLSTGQSAEFLGRAETIGFVDAEGNGVDKLYFNGNLFRRDSIDKTKRVLDSLSSTEQAKGAELAALLNRHGCVGIDEAERILGQALFEKLKAAGMYDVNHVTNPGGDFGFVTTPAAFHKFTNPLVDDAFDLAKALVAALTYGMTQSGAGRGKITMIRALLAKLNHGEEVGPATAIGEDYKLLELRGVIRVRPAVRYGHFMRLLKRDIGEMALQVLTTADAASTAVLDRPLPGEMTGYRGPELSRTDLRKKQSPPSKRLTQDVLNTLRTGGGL